MHTIRQGSEKDIGLIRDLTYRVWPQTYAGILPKEQIDYMLDLMYSESSLQRQMREGSRFRIAFDGEEPVAFAAYLPKTKTIFKLDKIYVLPSQQGKGTGKLLLNHIVDEIRAEGATALQLNVNRYNKARHFYERLGFVVISEGDFDIGNGYFMNDYIMELPVG